MAEAPWMPSTTSAFDPPNLQGPQGLAVNVVTELGDDPFGTMRASGRSPIHRRSSRLYPGRRGCRREAGVVGKRGPPTTASPVFKRADARRRAIFSCAIFFPTPAPSPPHALCPHAHPFSSPSFFFTTHFCSPPFLFTRFSSPPFLFTRFSSASFHFSTFLNSCLYIFRLS